jgi:hypothetical protein
MLASLRSPWLLITTLSLTSLANALLSPALLPEQVVQLQLQALQQSDLYSAYKLYSPDSKEAIGQFQNFESIVSIPPFDSILGHSKADILMTACHEEGFTGCLVRIVPSEKYLRTMNLPCLEYWWEVSKQYEEGPLEGCWMIDSVMPNFEDMNIDELDLEDMLEIGDWDDDDDDDELFFDTGF